MAFHKEKLLFLTLIILFLGFNKISPYDNCDFHFAILKYRGGGDWYESRTGVENLMTFFSEKTGVKACKDAKIVEPSKGDIFLYPLIYINGHGNISFNKKESSLLREYLKRGGFIFANDDYGMDKAFRREMKKVFPNKNFVELPFSHNIFHNFYKFPLGLPKIHKHEGGRPKAYGLFHEGRMVVLYAYNADIGDGWADKDVHKDPKEKRLSALKMAVNILVYALNN